MIEDLISSAKTKWSNSPFEVYNFLILLFKSLLSCKTSISKMQQSKLRVSTTSTVGKIRNFRRLRKWCLKRNRFALDMIYERGTLFQRRPCLSQTFVINWRRASCEVHFELLLLLRGQSNEPWTWTDYFVIFLPNLDTTKEFRGGRLVRYENS